MKKKSCQLPISFFYMQRDLEKDNGHHLLFFLKRSGTVSVKTVHTELDKMAERMFFEFAESGCPNFHGTSPLSRGLLKSKGHGKLSIHYSADLETIETVFRLIVSSNQLSLYGAVANMCEECESLHDRSGRHLMY